MTETPVSLLAFFTPGPMELVIIGVIAVLLFGKRLPEVGKSLGKGLMEFKKGVRGVEEEIETASNRPSYSYEEEREESTAPRFDPPPTDDPAASADNDEPAGDEEDAAKRLQENYR